MTDDPFLTLIVEALNLMHPRFAGAAVRSLRYEFYHQFRHLWDKALPVRLGLGHILIRDEPGAADAPDFLVWQLGEHGQPDRRLAAVSLALLPDAATDLERLRTFAAAHGYSNAVGVVAGRTADEWPVVPGVVIVFFDTERWRVQEDGS